jgi:hypothetical protein
MDGDRSSGVVETVEITGGAQSFTIPVAAEPSEVRLDPGTWVLVQADFGPASR